MGQPPQQQEPPGFEGDLDPPADHGESSYRGQGKLEGRAAIITGADSGIGRAVAIAFAREGADVLISYLSEDEDAEETARIVEEAGSFDEQYEGCLSFFDVRGMVPRPMSISVEHTDIDGTQRITIFERGHARLVAHEVDHLHGTLYRSKMRPGVQPIPVSEYRGTGQTWQYGKASS